MNPRLVTAGVGGLMVILGVAALLQPGMVMERVLGFAVDPGATEKFVHGEVRAVYGGIFTVVGVFTALATMDPYAHRSRILMVGMIWLGACAGRIFGVATDGSPGLFGWFSTGFEAAVGLALIAAARTAALPQAPATTVRPIEPQAPSPETPAA